MNAKKEMQLKEAIATLPRVAMASLRPTPLEPMLRLSEYLGGPQIYIKRDDLTGLAFGGNKTRMFEFALADALEKGADTIVAGSAVQSNYCRQLAAACAKLGLELHLVLRPVRPIDKLDQQGNNLLQRLLGAEVTVIKEYDHASQKAAIRAKIEELSAEGKKVYWPRQEDTIDLDAIAYAESGLEIVEQCRELDLEPSHLYLCALDTTQAGVALGLAYVESDIHVRGFCPSKGVHDRHDEMAVLANQGAKRLGLDLEMKGGDFDNDDTFVGERYGIPTPAGLDALRTVARTEGILLDPVYTSKAMAALFKHIREGQLDKSRPVVFLHTGGAPALFAYAADVLDV
jgi:1-aminocyclopropane-1-carboxylate deaminase/D-cysteine desulfhydrase-like pyridoxal-dependent ACC family enzyme